MTTALDSPVRDKPHVARGSPGDVHVIYALASACRHSEVCRRMAYLGRDLFPDEPSVRVARAIITNSAVCTIGLTERQIAAARTLWHQVAKCVSKDNIGVELDDAHHWLSMLAEREHLPLLVSALEWGAERLRETGAVGFVKRQIMGAFDVAEGKTSLEGAINEGRAA